MQTVRQPPEAALSASPGDRPAPAPARRPAAGLARSAELVMHLAWRELTATHRFTLLGWAWPLVRQLAQLAVLVLVFSSIFDLGIENYPVFVFSGLIAWSWFSSGLLAASTTLLAQRHLVYKARFPTIVLPLVAVAVPLVDVAMAIPVLLAMLLIQGGLEWSVLLLPPLLLVQLVLTCGLAWFAAALTVYLRDVPQLVNVALTILFYLTPVFYSTDRIPQEYRWIIQLNPMTTLIESYRAVLLGDRFPPTGHFVAVAVAGVLIAVAGLLCFRRLSGGFVDEL